MRFSAGLTPREPSRSSAPAAVQRQIRRFAPDLHFLRAAARAGAPRGRLTRLATERKHNACGEEFDILWLYPLICFNCDGSLTMNQAGVGEVDKVAIVSPF